MILFDETIRQSTKDGTPFTKVLLDAGIIPGIKLDAGAKPLAKASGETVTEGWMACAIASLSITKWVPVLPNGAL